MTSPDLAIAAGSRRSPLRAVAALLASVAFLLAGHGLLQTYLPLRGGLAGFSGVSLGLLGSLYFAGYVLGCLLGPRAIIAVGHTRTFAAAVSVAASAALVQAMVIHPAVWGATRALVGLCFAALFLVIESWLNERADNSSRGRIIAAYLTVNLGMMTAGQMLVAVIDPAGFHLFALGAILISLAAVPVALSTAEQPAPITLVRFRPLALYCVSPSGVVGIFLVGVSNGAFWALGPAFGQQIGLTIPETALYMSLAVISGAVVQAPIGMVSDRLDRRIVIIALGLVAAALGSLIALQPGSDDVVRAALALAFGAAILPTYAVTAAHVFDNASSEGFVEVSAALLLLFGIGSVLGPLPASALMQAVRPGMLFGFMAAVNVIMALYVAWRMTQRSAMPDDLKRDYRLSNVAPVAAVGDNDAFVESPLVLAPEDRASSVPRDPLASQQAADAVAKTPRLIKKLQARRHPARRRRRSEPQGRPTDPKD